MVAVRTPSPSATDRPAVTAPLIHIGYHKTATSWLQKRAFSSAALGFALVEPRRLLNEQVAAPHDLDFDPDRCRAFFEPRLDEARLAGLVPVLSTERLCGDVLYGAYDSVLIAERLAATWPEAKIAIVIREQREMVVASYQQYVRAGGQLRFEQYARRPPARGRYLLPFVVPHFEYDRLIGHYRRLFGAEEVLVLPFELFRREAARRDRGEAARERARPGTSQSLGALRRPRSGRPNARARPPGRVPRGSACDRQVDRRADAVNARIRDARSLPGEQRTDVGDDRPRSRRLRLRHRAAGRNEREPAANGHTRVERVAVGALGTPHSIEAML